MQDLLLVTRDEDPTQKMEQCQEVAKLLSQPRGEARPQEAEALRQKAE